LIQKADGQTANGPKGKKRLRGKGVGADWIGLEKAIENETGGVLRGYAQPGHTPPVLHFFPHNSSLRHLT
jgi:hypothetical protein